MQLSRPLAVCGALAIVASGAMSDAYAQQIYKIVGPDGRVTFSDKAPLDPSIKASPASVVPITSDSASMAAFPYELRQAASRYPVTLYTSPGCQVCAESRQYLVSRGVPFAEKTVSTREDADALSRIAGTQSVPLLTIGSQQLKGFADSEWSQFLDAAGYPKTSMLPASYAPPQASPLVALDQRGNGTAARAAARPAPPPPAPTPQEPAPSNPAGITF